MRIHCWLVQLICQHHRVSFCRPVQLGSTATPWVWFCLLFVTLCFLDFIGFLSAHFFSPCVHGEVVRGNGVGKALLCVKALHVDEDLCPVWSRCWSRWNICVSSLGCLTIFLILKISKPRNASGSKDLLFSLSFFPISFKEWSRH